MKRCAVLLVIVFVMSLVVPVQNAMSEGLDQYFNGYTTSTLDKTQLTIGNVKIGDTYYWGTWEMQNDLSFKLSDAGIVTDDTFFNVMKACKSGFNATKVDEGESLPEAFDTTGCEKYYKYESQGYTYYCCEGGNFFRALGKTKDGAVYAFHGFVLPLYMADGTSVSFDFTVGNDTSHKIHRTESVYKENTVWKALVSFTSPTFFDVMSVELDASTYAVISVKHGHGEWPTE